MAEEFEEEDLENAEEANRLAEWAASPNATEKFVDAWKAGQKLKAKQRAKDWGRATRRQPDFRKPKAEKPESPLNPEQFKPSRTADELRSYYPSALQSQNLEDTEDTGFEEMPTVGIDALVQRRLIPLGRLINIGKPYFVRFPPVTDKTYNVFTFVAPMGSGKCCPSSVVILTKEFGAVQAHELYDLVHAGKMAHVYSLLDGQEPIWSLVTDAWFSGTKELFEVRIEGGARLQTSAEHKFMVWRDRVEEVRLAEMSTSDWVLSPKRIDVPEWADPEKEEHALMCGIFIADGNSRSHKTTVSNVKFREFLLKYFAKQDIHYTEYYRKNCWQYRTFGENTRRFKQLIGVDQEYCVAGNKRVPAWIFQNKAYMRSFLQGVVECDGSLLTSKNRKGKQKVGQHCIELVMKSREVVNAVALMLLAFGIRSCFATKQSRATNSNMESQKYYRLTVQGNDNLRRYMDVIGLFTEFQKERIKGWDTSAEHNSNMRYNLSSWIDRAKPALYELKIAGQYWGYLNKKQMPADNHRFRDLLAKLKAGGFEELAEEALWLIDNYYMAKVTDIVPVGQEKAYDFEVAARNFLAGDGCGMFVHNSTVVRSMIYYIDHLEPDCLNIIFDPMKMEFSKLSVKHDTLEKREHLMDDTLLEPDTGRTVRIRVDPDSLKVFHIIPRFALQRTIWDQQVMGYRPGLDRTSLQIIKRDGGFIFAEDICRMSEEQIFNCLNYRELRTDMAVHFYLRAAIRICNNKHGEGNWFAKDLIDVLRDSVKKFRNGEELPEEFLDEEVVKEEKASLNTIELQLIEQLEKYREAGFFVETEAERKKFCVDWRRFVRLDRILNISFMGFKKTDKIGEDLVQGQADLILERLIEISNEYYDAVRKVEQDMETTAWEQYLLQKWKISLWFEESEIFAPRDCPSQNIKKWPCIKRLDYLMSFGRKFGFKNFGFVTQRITKVNMLIFKESSHLFIGPIIGEERDSILHDFGVDKVKFNMYDKLGQVRVVAVRDIVTTLDKDKHEWIFVDKGRKSIAAIQTYDSPVG